MRLRLKKDVTIEGGLVDKKAAASTDKIFIVIGLRYSTNLRAVC
jgi:hypothetical protein